MAISEAQLKTWSAQGKTGQFTDTYNTIRGHLLDKGVPYPVADVEVFLQGSYGNDTNVYADSDVDIVLKHTGAFYYDINGITPQEQTGFHGAYPKDAEYGYPAATLLNRQTALNPVKKLMLGEAKRPPSFAQHYAGAVLYLVLPRNALA